MAAACVEFIFGPLATDPRNVGAPLRTPYDGRWRARRGEYRVRHRIDEQTETVYVFDVDHRRDAYRGRIAKAAWTSTRAHGGAARW
jgi:mRNA-degrading endonuclease RelE of RelBE toxin-antitoxin system